MLRRGQRWGGGAVAILCVGGHVAFGAVILGTLFSGWTMFARCQPGQIWSRLLTESARRGRSLCPWYCVAILRRAP